MVQKIVQKMVKKIIQKMVQKIVQSIFYPMPLMYVENLEMNNSLKWALFIKVSDQITSDTLWK